jgi:hypothetical protein
MDPPLDHPWAGKHWNELASIFAADFDRILRADFNRLGLYAVGRKALATDTPGAALHPEAVDEVEKRYDTLLSDVRGLHREISSLNKRAAARPAPKDSVAEGKQKATSTMVAYSSTLEHTVRMQIVWHRKEVKKAEQAALACQQLLRGQDGG